LTYDGPALLKVRGEDDTTQWVVTSGGFRSCSGAPGNLSDIAGKKVTVRGEMNSFGKLDVCRAGTYIKILENGGVKVDSIVTFKGSVEYYDPTPTYVDGPGILIVKAVDGELWDIGFGGDRIGGCAAPFPYQELGEGKKTVAVAGRMLKNGTLDVCGQGTFVTAGASRVDRSARRPFALGIHGLVPTSPARANRFSVDGRIATAGGPATAQRKNEKPWKSISFGQKGEAHRIIVRP
jgi:hypothetical protein